MGLDPTLITNAMAQWQQPADPLARFAKIQALKTGLLQQQQAEQQLQTGQLDLQQKQREISGQDALAAAIRQSLKPGVNGAPPTVDDNAVVQTLGAGPHADLVTGYVAGMTKRQQDQAALKKTQIENAQQSLDLVSRNIEDANDQASWDKAIATMHGLGVDTQQLGVPPVYSEQAKQAVLAHGISYKDHLAAQSAAMDAQAKKADSDVTVAKDKRQQIKEALDAVAGATSQDDLNAKRSAVIAAGGSPADVNSIPMRFDPDAVATYRATRLTPEQTTQAEQAKATAAAAQSGRDETARHNRVQESIEATRNQLQQSAARGDRSYQAATHELDQIGKPVTDAVARLGKLQDTLAQNTPQADALVAPELMSIMAGGAGSGLRMNESEIARVIGGRSKWQDLQAAVNKWQLDPTKANSITDEQRRQIRSLTQAVSDKLYAKQNALNDAYKTVAGSQDPNDHRQAVLGVRQAIANVDAPGAAGGTSTAATGTAPPLPLKFSQSDVGKTFANKTGQRIRVTAVNPANPAQFQSVVVP